MTVAAAETIIRYTLAASFLLAISPTQELVVFMPWMIDRP